MERDYFEELCSGLYKEVDNYCSFSSSQESDAHDLICDYMYRAYQYGRDSFYIEKRKLLRDFERRELLGCESGKDWESNG